MAAQSTHSQSLHSLASQTSSKPTSRPASLRGSPKAKQVTGDEMLAIIQGVIDDPEANVQLPLRNIDESKNNSDTDGSGANSLPASIDLLTPSPNFKKPAQPVERREERKSGSSGQGQDWNKENTPPHTSNPSSPTQRSPIIPSHDIQRSSFRSPPRSTRLIKDHLSPRLGLPVSTRDNSATILSRIQHTRPFPPSQPIGDLTGNLPMFLEMRSFTMRPSTSLTPERHSRERGRK